MSLIVQDTENRASIHTTESDESFDESFTWNDIFWVEHTQFKDNVFAMTDKQTKRKYIIKKFLSGTPKSIDSWKPPKEIEFLNELPDCNRIVQPLDILGTGKLKEYTLIFPAFKHGDLELWRATNFEQKDSKPIPEAFIWRFLVHMSQALAVSLNTTGPNREERKAILHHDIKPANILVSVDKNQYPSFHLHDFGVSSYFDPSRRNREAFGGTYIWQPPEHPYTHTHEAEVWAMGACAHFLAFGDYLIPKYSCNWFTKLGAEQLRAAKHFKTWYRSDRQMHDAWGLRQIAPLNEGATSLTDHPVNDDAFNKYRPTYSDKLNYWVMRCLSKHTTERPTIDQLNTDMVRDAKVALAELGGEEALADLELRFE